MLYDDIFQGKCMKALGIKLTPKEVKFLIACADKDENGKMDKDEFCLTATIMVTSYTSSNVSC